MHAKKRLGQNFLVGSHYPSRILSFVKSHSDETIVEIGPGHGALTEGLIRSGARVIAVELDRDLIPELENRFGEEPNFSIIQADALKVDFQALIAPAATARVVANLPYYIATPLLQRLIESRACITEMTLMLQREVVDRIVAEPACKEYGYLSALVQLFCTAEKLFDVPPGAFRPVPKVTSSIVRIRRHEASLAPPELVGFLIEVMQTIFAQRRKTILNNLKAGRVRLKLGEPPRILVALEASGIDPRRRGETLSIAETIALASNLQSLAPQARETL